MNDARPVRAVPAGEATSRRRTAVDLGGASGSRAENRGTAVNRHLRLCRLRTAPASLLSAGQRRIDGTGHGPSRADKLTRETRGPLPLRHMTSVPAQAITDNLNPRVPESVTRQPQRTARLKFHPSN